MRHFIIGLAVALCAVGFVRADPMIGPIDPVDELNSPYSDQQCTLTGNGQYMVFQSRRGGEFDSKLWSASRSDITGSFSEPSNADFLNVTTHSEYDYGSPVISSDGLTLFYTSTEPLHTQAIPDADSAIYVATRPSLNAPFSEGKLALDLLQPDQEQARAAWLSPDQLQIYFAFHPLGVEWNIYMAERISIESAFGPPSNLMFTNITNSHGNFEPSLTSDELEIYYTSKRPDGLGGATDIWWASRPGRDVPFGSPLNLEAVNSPYMDRHPLVFGDSLFFASTYNQGTNNPKDLDIYYVAIIPEPSALILLIVAIPVLLLFRLRLDAP